MKSLRPLIPHFARVGKAAHLKWLVRVQPAFLCLVLGLLVAGCDNPEGQTAAAVEKKGPAYSQQLLTLNNRGVAEMGRFEYARAEKTFAQALQLAPDVLTVRINHLISLLNRQNPGDEVQALQEAEALAGQYPDNVQAPYIAGLLHFNEGRCAKALPYFERVIQSDPQDAYALYFAGQCLLQNGQPSKAFARFQQAISADGYLRSAYYSAFMAAQQAGQSEQAEKFLAAYQKLQANPQSRLAEIKYTRMGPKAEVWTLPLAASQAIATPATHPPYFAGMRTHSLAADMPDKPLAINAVDFAGDGHTELAVLTANGIYRLALPDSGTTPQQAESPQTTPLPEIILPLAANSAEQRAMAWGDVNNDGQLDVVIAGAKSRLWLGQEDGFQPAVTGQFGLGQADWKNVRLADADHDGDLDMLVITAAGRFELWNNNLDGSWRVLNQEKHIPILEDVEQIILADVDADRDLDIILRQHSGVQWLQNDRMWHYRLQSLPEMKTPVRDLVVTDLDNDGFPDWVALTADGLQQWVFEPGRHEVIASGPLHPLQKPASGLLAADISGDGFKELLLFSDQQLTVFNHDTGSPIELVAFPAAVSGQAPVLIHGIHGPELWWLADSRLMQLPASDQRQPFVLLAFAGAEDPANAVRSNKSGVGVKFTAFAGDCASSGNTWQNQSVSGQDWQPVSVACRSKTLDFIAINWPDGVYQTEQSLETGRFYRISETQRQLSSCPVIFLKREGSYQFESDVLGVGGIGFALGRDEYGQPRPWENYLIDASRWQAENGRYSLLITEPMEEAAYLDSIAVKVIDVPAGWQVVLDERMQTGPPAVTGQPVYYRTRLNPKSITRQDGKDLTARGLKADNRAIEPAAFDARFIGFAEGEQTYTLAFDPIPAGDWILLMRGWVEYGYSQTGFAAWQAGLRWQPPSIDVWRAGRWHTVLTEAGYPAGMPRLASLPLGDAVVGAEKIRIRSNQELYLDELALVRQEQPSQVQTRSLPLDSARLFKLGFPKRVDGPQRLPDYEFSQRRPFWDTRYMRGLYTHLGDVSPLLAKTDNALAIIGPGEAIEVQFTDTLPPLADGWRRYFVLEFAGWAKDMDMLTRDGESLAPIPHRGPVSERAHQLNRKYNVRFQHGR